MGYELNYREKIVTWVWERMTALYGERWLKVYGPVWDAKRERERKKKPQLFPRLAKAGSKWSDYLAPLKHQAITRAIERCEQRVADGMCELPTLPEFLRMCQADNGRVETRIKPSRQETEAEREARRRRGREALTRLRTVVG